MLLAYEQVLVTAQEHHTVLYGRHGTALLGQLHQLADDLAGIIFVLTIDK